MDKVDQEDYVQAMEEDEQDDDADSVPTAGTSLIPDNVSTDSEAPLAVTASKKEVSIVLVGKSGAGKTTLARNILDFKRQIELCASHITQENDTQEATMNGITVKVTDTVGMEDRKQRKKGLRELCKHTQGKADLLVYCIPVDPSSKFQDSNPAIMKSLQNGYGKDVWKQCIIAFTFSNLTLERLKRNIRDHDQAIAMYKNLLVEHATKFREELKKLKVQDINVREVFGFQPEITPESEDQTTIVAIPVGDEPDDPVLPDFKDPFKFEIPMSSLIEESLKIDITDWREILFIEIVRKCSTSELKKNLLQYRFGREIAKSLVTAVGGITGGATSGLVGGAAIGAGVGALIGLVGGGFGAIPGAVVGTAIGGAIGVLGGGVGGGAATQIPKIRKNKK